MTCLGTSATGFAVDAPVRVLVHTGHLRSSDPEGAELAHLERLGIDTTILRRIEGKPTRPVFEVSGNQLFLALKTMNYQQDSGVVELNDVIFAVSPRAFVTVSDLSTSFAVAMRNALGVSVGEPEASPLVTFHSALEMVIDSHIEAIERLDRDVKRVESRVFSGRRGDVVEAIYRLLRAVTDMEQAITPLAGEPLDRVIKRRAPEWITADAYSDGIGADGIAELDNQLYRVVARVHGLRTLLGSILDANLTQVSLRQNTDMRKISAWVAIASVPTLIAGIYGMNFEIMPELTWCLGYPFALTLMVSVGATLFWRFRKNEWL